MSTRSDRKLPADRELVRLAETKTHQEIADMFRVTKAAVSEKIRIFLSSTEPIYIPAGEYYTQTQISRIFNVTTKAVRNWIELELIKVYELPSASGIHNKYLIPCNEIKNFTPPNRGAKRKRI